MTSPRRERSFQESRLPKGALLVGALLIVLGAGVYLIVAGLS